MKKAPVLAGILFVLPSLLAAQQPDPREKKNEERLVALEERVRALETELQGLKAVRVPQPRPQAAAARLLLASAPGVPAAALSADPAAAAELGQTQGAAPAQL